MGAAPKQTLLLCQQINMVMEFCSLNNIYYVGIGWIVFYDNIF